MQILYSLIGGAVIAIAVTWYFSWYFSKKAEKVAIDISGFMMQEINKNPNYVYPYYVGKGKDRKLHKGVLVGPIKITGGGNITATGVKEE
jgi:hypothetical protein